MAADYSESSKTASVEEGDTQYGRYGWGKLKPDWLQWLNNAKGFLAVQCLAGTIQSMLTNGFFVTSISTMEKRFGLNSAELGVIGTCYEIAFCACTLFVSYFGARSHQPRIVAVGVVVIAVASLLNAVPHYTTPLYNFGDRTDVCRVARETCVSSNSYLHDYFYMFIFVQLMFGVGSTALYTLGLSFIEESVPRKSASLYLGIANGVSTFGPVIGFVVGGILLDMYVDFDKVDPSKIELTTTDPRWVGAWWLGPLITMGLSLFAAVLLFGFPRKFKGTERFGDGKTAEVYKDERAIVAMQRASFGSSFRDLIESVYLLFRNASYVFLLMADACEAMFIAGITAFLAKIVENQYQQTTGTSALLAGAVIIPGAVISNLASGYIIKRFDMKTVNILKVMIVSCVLFIAGFAVLFDNCPNTQITGISTRYRNQSELMNDLNAGCNQNCSCQEEFYIPVCGSDDNTYFSPCHAGCTDTTTVNGTQVYTNCSCIVPSDQTGASTGGDAQSGACLNPCTSLGLFLAIFFVCAVLAITPATPSLVLTFRIVPEKLRPFSLGVKWLFLRALGGIPGPILFGVVVDSGCILWQTRECDGTRGSCWIYDSDTLALYVFILGAACKLGSTVFFSLAYWVYKPVKSITKLEIEASPGHENNAMADCDDTKNTVSVSL